MNFESTPSCGRSFLSQLLSQKGDCHPQDIEIGGEERNFKVILQFFFKRAMLIINHSDISPMMNHLPKAQSVSLGDWTWFMSTLVYDIRTISK